LERSAASGLRAALEERIMYPGSKVRLNGPAYLVYSIADSIVDQVSGLT
jgi:hypothetical protein